MTIATSGKIENFIDSLKLKGEAKDVATVCFECDDDCQMFFEAFYFRNKHVIDDLIDFRDYKISKSKKTVDIFVRECYTINMRQAFESTFYELFEDWKIELVGEAILDGRTSLEQLFTDFQKNPNEKILKNLV